VATPGDTCVIDEHDVVLTFGDLCREAESVAAGLMAEGLGPDAVVSWQLPNRLEAVILSMALARLGAVQNPIIPLSRGPEIEFMVDQLGSAALVVPTTWHGFDHAAMASAVAERRPRLGVLVVDDRLPRADPADLPPPPDRGDVTRWVLYTSGTTSDPKGAPHTDLSVMASARNIASRMRMTSSDRNAIVFPFAHVGGIWFLLGNLMCGAASVLVERVDADAIDVLSRHGVTLAGSGPPFNLAYLERRRLLGDVVLPAVRAFPGGGQSRPAGMHDDLKRAFRGAGIVSGYGSTESGSISMADVADEDAVRAVTEGRPYDDTEVRLVDEAGRLVEAGGEGEICVRGPGVISSYVDPALNAAAFDADGFFRTGDLGRFDQRGNLIISGRLKDIIIRNGENISARLVEDLVEQHPDVREVAVIGLPDPRTGERACAVIVPEPGCTAPSVEDLRRYLVERGLAVFKAPERVEQVTEIPRNSNGKQLKTELRARFGSPA
jgi:acyl-CoA synthetase (AMP-forming)/AMP-acid ligase II